MIPNTVPGLILAAAMAFAASPAHAAPMVVRWTTWMRTAPSDHAKVIDELDAGWTVDVQKCEGGWCLVESNRALGYLPQALLEAQRRPALQPTAGAPCMPAYHYTPEQKIGLSVCPATPK